MTLMEQEAREAPHAVARFLAANAGAAEKLGARLRQSNCRVVATSARGSSDHAAAYFKYLVEILLGVPVASVGASVVSVYGSKLQLADAMCITISQSGKSPDILAVQEAAKQSGALTVALINAEGAPAASLADISMPLKAGPEHSVAATKSFITSLVAGALIVAEWKQDKTLLKAIHDLPGHLAAAAAVDWPGFAGIDADGSSLYILGRGPAYPIAVETALKLKETCAIHAEPFSLAEIMHGPLELLDEGFPVFAYVQDDAAKQTSLAAIEKFRKLGAHVLYAGEGGFPVAPVGHPLLAPISMIQTAYLMIERKARSLGRNPDAPRRLKKVTETT